MIKGINFLTSCRRDIEHFANLVISGDVKYSEIEETFKKIKLKIYNEEDAITIVNNLIIASNIVPFQRTDYQTPSSEALLYTLKFINIEGSINLKISYALFTYLVTTRVSSNNKKHYHLNVIGNKNLFAEFNKRLEHLSDKDKNSDTGQRIKITYELLSKKRFLL